MLTEFAPCHLIRVICSSAVSSVSTQTVAAVVGLSAVNVPVHATYPFHRKQHAGFVSPFRRFAVDAKTAFQVNYARFGCLTESASCDSLSVLSFILEQTALGGSSIADELTACELTRIILSAAISPLAIPPRNVIFARRQLVEERGRPWWLAICPLGATKSTPRRHSRRRSDSLRYAKQFRYLR